MFESQISLMLASHWLVFAQVIEGETEIVNIRETNSSLSALIFALILLGVLSILGTVVFGWFTRPKGIEQRDG